VQAAAGVGREERCGAGVAEDRAHALITWMDVAAVSLCRQKEQVGGQATLQKALGHSQTIDVAGTAQIKVECTTTGGQLQAMLKQASRCGQQIIRALSAEEQEVHLCAVALGQDFLGGSGCQIRSALPVLNDMALSDASFLVDFVGTPSGV
jgi:hypothetical protein